VYTLRFRTFRWTRTAAFWYSQVGCWVSQVAVLARTEAEVRDVAAEVGGLAVVADVSDAAQVRAAFATVESAYGRVDVVVNNAGQAVASSIESMSDAEWRQTVDCNLSGTFYCCREAMRAMRSCHRGGVIVNVGSSSARGEGRLEQGAYASTKAGIHNLTETLAMEGRQHKILAYCVAPIRTATDLRKELAPDEAAELCLKPSDVAAAVVSVIMDANPHLSGQSFWLRHP
jgi:NAD(P)-dependent dehydrogenase (short-subunit alcohol dehydrogenase family)